MLHVCGVYLLRFCCAYSNVYIYLFIGVNDMYQYSFYANKCIENVPENPAALRAGTHSRTRREQFSSSVRRRQVMLQQQTGHVPCFMSGDLLTYSSSSLRSLHFVHVGMGAGRYGSRKLWVHEKFFLGGHPRARGDGHPVTSVALHLP